MKRIIALFLAVVLLLSLVGCATTTTETAPAAKESDAAPTVETESSKQNNSGEATTIKIALYAPITGNNAQYGLAYCSISFCGSTPSAHHSWVMIPTPSSQSASTMDARLAP